MNKKLLIVPLVLASSAAWAQSRTVSGQVLDAAGPRDWGHGGGKRH
ncbi:hypothetical protein [Hymenobacter coccineus]|nr:hypothetical protein [Hymenobacter coccineus]